MKETVVIHSGGMDSSICLALAVKEYGSQSVASLSFSYQQRHSSELIQAKKICQDWSIEHKIVDLSALQTLTTNALMDSSLPIEHPEGEEPNTLVVGRNGLMARLGAIYADSISAKTITMGILQMEEGYYGYRDCSRGYIDLVEAALKIDLDRSDFEIKTPLVHMTKAETMNIAKELGVLDYLLKNTVTCYEGIIGEGCRKCPACFLRAKGIAEAKIFD